MKSANVLIVVWSPRGGVQCGKIVVAARLKIHLGKMDDLDHFRLSQSQCVDSKSADEVTC